MHNLAQREIDVLLACATHKVYIPDYGEFTGVIHHAMMLYKDNSVAVEREFKVFEDLEKRGYLERVQFIGSIGHGFKLTQYGHDAIMVIAVAETLREEQREKRLQSIYQEMYR